MVLTTISGVASPVMSATSGMTVTSLAVHDHSSSDVEELEAARGAAAGHTGAGGALLGVEAADGRVAAQRGGALLTGRAIGRAGARVGGRHLAGRPGRADTLVVGGSVVLELPVSVAGVVGTSVVPVPVVPGAPVEPAVEPSVVAGSGSPQAVSASVKPAMRSSQGGLHADHCMPECRRLSPGWGLGHRPRRSVRARRGSAEAAASTPPIMAPMTPTVATSLPASRRPGIGERGRRCGLANRSGVGSMP